MDFFGIGPLEILLVLIITLIIMGPGRLPEIARTLGKTLRAARKASADFTSAITRELDTTPKETDQSSLKEKDQPETCEPPPPSGQEETKRQDDRRETRRAPPVK